MTTNLKIDGMMCEACVSHVTRALQNVSGVSGAQVVLAASSARIEHEGASEAALLAAVEEEGYSAQVAQP